MCGRLCIGRNAHPVILNIKNSRITLVPQANDQGGSLDLGKGMFERVDQQFVRDKADWHGPSNRDDDVLHLGREMNGAALQQAFEQFIEERAQVHALEVARSV
jgi:hypothetical protein